MYEPTPKQIENWSKLNVVIPTIPDDEEFKERWKKQHHGKVAGWGMGKRDWIVSEMRNTPQYQLGIWQGRVDAAQGLDYSEERNDSPYNLGYYRGYNEYKERGTGGWNNDQAKLFVEEYAKKEKA